MEIAESTPKLNQFSIELVGFEPGTTQMEQFTHLSPPSPAYPPPWTPITLTRFKSVNSYRIKPGQH